MADYSFHWNDRLGIELPELANEWEAYSEGQREAVLVRWEAIRGTIPERIFDFERQINEKQRLMFEVEDFEACCRLNAEIAELASRINDLHIWYRINQEIEKRPHS